MLKQVAAYYTLRKSHRVLRQNYRLYKRKAASLPSEKKERLQSLLSNLQTAIAQKNPEIADRMARSLEDAAKNLMPKTFLDKARTSIGQILFALLVAIAIRQTWFEFYTIPSGSARPTLKEEDLLLVSKTDYGINTLTPTGHLYFDPSLVERGSIVILSGKDMDIYDVDTKYFYVIPGKKQFVKRLIGKPGDSLYFYGGRIFGVSANGKDLTELRDTPWFEDLEHIPFIRFNGKVETPNAFMGIFPTSVFYQMNEPVAKLTTQPHGGIAGEVLYPRSLGAKNYYDLWGIKNFAMSRILTAEEAKALHPTLFKELEEAPLYLEFSHHPSFSGAKLEKDEYGRMRPSFSLSTSLLPVSQDKIDSLMKHMSTCRFTVKNGVATRHGASFEPKTFLPRMPDVPDGTYEILNGKGYRVLFWGVTKELDPSHPLLKTTPGHVEQLYNLGIEMDTRFSPSLKKERLAPSRYGYFAYGDLYLMGAPIFFKNDSALVQFLHREYQKQAVSSTRLPYAPFDDEGAPMRADGIVDAEFIRKFGLTVPEGMYLVLGDNHAMSGDSRQFGFVPQDNLRGGASFLLWPPGPRWGRLPQPGTNHFALPNVTILSFFLLSAVGTTLYLRRKYAKPFQFDNPVVRLNKNS